ncbi:MAG: hypothetical protein HXY18_16965 [Bryobacteraceae bacterium]|nr:hypothetical protein [Bryobacteraceae bacterium]
MMKLASEDLWRRTVSQIPSIYGRLVYLGRLRNTDTGRYEHHGLAAMFDEALADSALRESHLSSFRDWLNSDLEQQRADLELYLSEQPTSRRTLLETWLRLAPYRATIPAGASPADRDLFLGEFEALLRILLNETRG